MSENLQGFTDLELLAELGKRKREREEQLATDRKKREVEVVCPDCKGCGITRSIDQHSGYPCEYPCGLCGGKGWLVALRR